MAAPKPHKRKRRTESEMMQALRVIDAHKSVLHSHADDEHVPVLADAVTELLTLRAMTTTLMQQLNGATNEANSTLKNMWIS